MVVNTIARDDWLSSCFEAFGAVRVTTTLSRQITFTTHQKERERERQRERERVEVGVIRFLYFRGYALAGHFNANTNFLLIKNVDA